MTLTLTREDFAHTTRQAHTLHGLCVTICTCGWESEPCPSFAHLPRVCPYRGQPVPPKAEDWYPPKTGTHDAGRLCGFDPPVTTESIAEAKAHRDAERRELERMVPGIRILEDGTVIHPHR
mgnify:FL=1